MLQRIKGIARELRDRTLEDRDRYRFLLLELADRSPFPDEVVLRAGWKEARARFWHGLPLEPETPDLWSFRMFGSCLDQGQGEAFATMTREERIATYQSFRREAALLWEEWAS